jgi:hypothetical protein
MQSAKFKIENIERNREQERNLQDEWKHENHAEDIAF